MNDHLTSLLDDDTMDYSDSQIEVVQERTCKFDKPRYSKLSKKHMQIIRLTSAIVNILNILFNHWIVFCGLNSCYVPYPQIFAYYYYSLWGSIIAVSAHILSFRACNNEKWTRSAYYATEFSFGVNFFIEFVMLLDILPL